ncbi:MAG: thioesterase family protein [Desulfovibrionaceae bacterium]|nr:thioesterase family protein [Desulfovibrionaceae bacterium]
MSLNANFPTPHIWIGHRISYGETDAMGIVYYAEYLHIFERARDAYIRASGFSYNEVEARGIYLPVREVQCRYRSPARFDDVVHCRVAIAEWGRASLTFEYEMTSEARDRVLVTGMTQHASADKNGRPVRMPDWLKAITDSVENGAFYPL